MQTEQTIPQNRVYKFIELPKQNYNLLNGSLIEGIIETGRDAFGPSMSAEEIKDHIYPTDHLYLAYKQNRIVGFATAIVKETYIDLVGAAIREEAQGSSIYSDFVLKRINLALTKEKNAIQLRTQNPRVYLGVQRCLESITNIGLITSFSTQQELRQGLYGRMLTDKQPYSNDTGIDKLFSILNYQRGDAFQIDIQMEVRP